MKDPTTTTTFEAKRALQDRGVAAHVAETLARTQTPDLCGQWAAYGARHPQMGPGALVNAIRSGSPPPRRPSQIRTEQERSYADKVADWLRQHFPDLCDERSEPHWAAVRTVIRMHHRYGRGSLTVREHGQAIRGAVLDAEAELAEERER